MKHMKISLYKLDFALQRNLQMSSTWLVVPQRNSMLLIIFKVVIHNSFFP